MTWKKTETSAETMQRVSTEPMLKVSDLAIRLRISENSAREICREGHIRCFKVGPKKKQYRIPESAIAEYLESVSHGPQPTAKKVSKPLRSLNNGQAQPLTPSQFKESLT